MLLYVTTCISNHLDCFVRAQHSTHDCSCLPWVGVHTFSSLYCT